MAKRKKYKPVEFTAHERRVFELGFRTELKGPEAETLRKMIDAMPFITLVAECRFDPKVADAALAHAATEMNLNAEIKASSQRFFDAYNKAKK